MLRRAVMREPCTARVDRVDRADVDDRPAVTLLAHAAAAAARVQRKAPPTLTPRMRWNSAGVELLQQEVREHAGVVHEHVEPAEALDRGARRARSTSSSTETSPSAAATVAPSSASRAPRAFEPVDAPVGEHDRGSRLGETPGAREAEPLGGAGDERRPCRSGRRVTQAALARRRAVSARRHGRTLTGSTNTMEISYKIIREHEQGNGARWRHC